MSFLYIEIPCLDEGVLVGFRYSGGSGSERLQEKAALVQGLPAAGCLLNGEWLSQEAGQDSGTVGAYENEDFG